MANFLKTIVSTVLLSGSVSVCLGGEYRLAVVSLDEATKKFLEDSRIKVLGAKTEVVGDRQIHIIKILTSDGRIQYHRIDAETGHFLTRDR